MPKCAKCGKKVKVLYGKWKYKEPFPEFYNKPLCNSCHIELERARIESAKATAVEALCEHLRRMGLNATVKSKVYPFPIQWGIIGSVRIVNRNIDFVEMEWAEKSVGDEGFSIDVYRCNFVVQAKADGLEDKLRAYTEPVTKGLFSSQVVDFQWKGKELAHVLNSDADVRKTLYQLIVKYRGHSGDRPSVEVEPYRKDQCVRISPRFSYSPESTSPTIETFEAYDRIAQHIRNIAIIRP